MIKLQGVSFFLLNLTIIILLLIGCDSSSTDKNEKQDLAFDVDDTLLELPFELTQANMEIRPPVGFKAVSDSYHQELQSFFLKERGANTNLQFHQFFFDSLHSAGMVVFSVKELNLSSDTMNFFGNYQKVLEGQYGPDRVKSGEYWVNGIFVKNYLVTDSNTVRFQLLCLSSNNDAMEVHYIVPHSEYEQVVKLIESSIGSLKPKNGG
jgi:hypothetical protein